MGLLSAQENLQVLYDLGATGELFSMALYWGALKSSLAFTDVERAQLKAVLVSEYDHYQVFTGLGGVASHTEFLVPPAMYIDRGFFASSAGQLEALMVSAYLTVVDNFAQTEDPALTVTMGQIIGVEAQHQALLRQMARSLPHFAAFPAYLQQKLPQILEALTALMLNTSSSAFTIVPPTEAEVDAYRAELTALGFDTQWVAAIQG